VQCQVQCANRGFGSTGVVGLGTIEQSLDKNSSPYAALTRRLGEHGTATDQGSSHDHANTIPWKPIATQTGNSIQLLPNSADVISFIKSNTRKKRFYRILDIGRV